MDSFASPATTGGARKQASTPGPITRILIQGFNFKHIYYTHRASLQNCPLFSTCTVLNTHCAVQHQQPSHRLPCVPPPWLVCFQFIQDCNTIKLYLNVLNRTNIAKYQINKHRLNFFRFMHISIVDCRFTTFIVDVD